MKKNLLIFFIFIFSFTSVEADESISNNVSNISSDVENINSLLSSSLAAGESGYSIPAMLDEMYNTLSAFFYYDFAIEFKTFLQEQTDYITSSVNDVLNKLYDGVDVSWPDDIFGSIIDYLDTLNLNIGGLAENFSGLSTSSEYTNTLLDDIRADLKDIVSNTSKSNEHLTTATISYSHLNQFGIDVDTSSALAQSFQTTGEFNKDVHQLLIGLNQISASENNALLSILTNMQYLVSTLSSSADIQKVEDDIKSRESEVDAANQELYKIENQNWDNFFAPPQFLNDVYNNLQITVNPSELPQRIMIIDTFHFDSENFTCEISDVGFDLPNQVLDLAYYARSVFGFIYWSLTFFLAIFIFRLWIRLYVYVSQSLMSK